MPLLEKNVVIGNQAIHFIQTFFTFFHPSSNSQKYLILILLAVSFLVSLVIFVFVIAQNCY